MFGDGENVLVAAAGEIDHHQVILREFRRQLRDFRQGVRRLERGNDAFKRTAAA
jgi:hypothetical protein